MIELVIRASNILMIDELQLFSLSYEYWYAHEAEPRYIREVFSHYLSEKIAPPWVVHFARSVLRDYQTGNLDPEKFGIKPVVNENIPLGWSLAFKTPFALPSNDDDDVLIA